MIKISKIVNIILYVVLIIFALCLLLSLFSVKGFKILTVQSGSMQPEIKIGSLVFVRPVDNYEIGDIITFKSIDNPKQKITHRIVDIADNQISVLYQTKGDANDGPDITKVSRASIVGKVFGKVAYLGYPIGFVRTLPGLMIVVVIAAIIVFEEVKKVKTEMIKIVKDRVKRKKEASSVVKPKKIKKNNKNNKKSLPSVAKAKEGKKNNPRNRSKK
jgi:signal peptidase